MLAGGVRGRSELRHVQAVLTSSPATLRRDLAAGVRKALRPLVVDVRREARTLPRAGGYAGIMAAAVRTSSRVSGGDRIRATMTVSAKGKVEARDVRAVNRGALRHPVYGNRKVWKTTTVRPGFVDRPMDRAKDRVVDMAREARDTVAEKIARG